MALLVQSLATGWLTLRAEPAVRSRYVEPSNLAHLSPKSAALHLPIVRRRGAEDLEAETWSALKHLQRMHPRHRLIPHFDGIPFGYQHVKTRTFVTAGNQEPAKVVRFIVEQNILHFGVLGYRWRAHPDKPGTLVTSSAQGYRMNWLDLTEEGHSAIKRFVSERPTC